MVRLNRRRLLTAAAEAGLVSILGAAAACKPAYVAGTGTHPIAISTASGEYTPVPAFTVVPSPVVTSSPVPANDVPANTVTPTSLPAAVFDADLSPVLRLAAYGIPFDMPYASLKLVSRSGVVLDKVAVLVKPGSEYFEAFFSPDKFASVAGQEVVARLAGYDAKKGSALEELVAPVLVPVPVPFAPAGVNGRSLEDIYMSDVSQTVSFRNWVEVNKVYGFVADKGTLVGSDVLVSQKVASPAPASRPAATPLPTSVVGKAGFAASLEGLLQLDINASNLPKGSVVAFTISDGAAPHYSAKLEVNSALSASLQLGFEASAGLARFAGLGPLKVSYRAYDGGRLIAENQGAVIVPFGAHVLYPFDIGSSSKEEIYNFAAVAANSRTMGYWAWVGLNQAAGFMDKDGKVIGSSVLVPAVSFEAINGKASGYVAVPQKATPVPKATQTPAATAIPPPVSIDKVVTAEERGRLDCGLFAIAVDPAVGYTLREGEGKYKDKNGNMVPFISVALENVPAGTAIGAFSTSRFIGTQKTGSQTNVFFNTPLDNGDKLYTMYVLPPDAEIFFSKEAGDYNQLVTLGQRFARLVTGGQIRLSAVYRDNTFASFPLKPVNEEENIWLHTCDKNDGPYFVKPVLSSK